MSRIVIPQTATLISSRLTGFNKRVVPLIFVAAVVISALGAKAGVHKDPRLTPLFLVPLVLGAVFYFVYKKVLADLQDQVWDAGDSLIVVQGGHHERILLANIMNVSYMFLMNPPRVTLMLRVPCSLGEEISFMAPIRPLNFLPNPVISELIRRIDAARKVS